MNVLEILGIVVAALGILIAALVGLAHAGDQGRQWFKSATLRLLAGAFYLFLVAGGALSVWSFPVGAGSPSRMEILILLLWVFNGLMGIVFAVSDLLSQRRTAKPD